MTDQGCDVNPITDWRFDEPVVYVRLEHTLEEYERLMRGVDKDAAKVLGKPS